MAEFSGIQIPTFANVSGGGFSPAIAEQNKNVALGMSNIPALAETANSMGQQMLSAARDRAYVQGQVDYFAKNIQEKSWLTEDAYKQGIKVADLSQGMLQYQSEVQGLARESVANGDDLTTFTSKLSPTIQRMQEQVQAAGLVGPARDAALQSVLGTVASSQKMYQQELEAQTQRNQDTAANQIGTSAVINSLHPNADASVIATNLDTAFDSTYQLYANTDPKTALNTASKKAYGAVAEIISRLQPNDPADLQKLKMLSAYMNTGAAQRWTPEEREAALGTIDKKFQDYRQFQNTYDQESIRTLETQVKAGNAGISDIRNMQSSLHARIATGELDPAQGNAMLDKLHAMALKADVDLGDEMLLTSGTYADWLRSGKSTGDLLTKKTAKIVESIGNTTVAGAVLMRESTRTNIPGEYEKGVGLITQGFANYLNTPATAITEVQESQAEALRAYNQAWQAAQDNPGQRDALMSALPKQWQGAMRTVLERGQVDTMDMRQLKSELDRTREYLTDQAAGGNKPFFGLSNVQGLKKKTPTGFKAKDFAGAVFKDGLEANYFSQPSDAILAFNADQANRTLLRYGDTLSDKGYIVTDAESAMTALLQEGLAIRTSAGPVFMEPGFKDSTGIDNSQALADTLDEVRQEIADKSGGRVKPENVRVVIAGNVATFVDYDDNNVPLRSFVQTPQDLNTRWQQKLEQQAYTAPENVLDTTQAGKTTMNITRHWGSAFGSNDLGVKVAKHLAWHEGWTDDWKNTRSAADQANPNLRQVEVIGPGITKQDHPEWVPKLEAAKGSPSKLSQVVGEFAGEYYKSYHEYVARAGIPPSTARDRKPDVTYIALADTMWHGGAGAAGAYADLIKLASTGREGTASALEQLKSLAVYKQAGTKRQSYLERGLSLSRVGNDPQGY